MQDRSEFTEIQVTVVRDGNNIVLTPDDKFGQERLGAILEAGEDRRLWNFMGSRYNDSFTKEIFLGASFACGGESYERRERNVIWTDYRNSVKIYLNLTDNEDTRARYAVRDFGYLSGGMVVIEGSTADRVVLSPMIKCKVCGGPLVRFIELEWQVCDTCHGDCNHDYKEGVGQSNGNIAWLPFCRKCGRGDPDWEPSEDPLDDLAKVVTEEGGIDMLLLKHDDRSVSVLSRGRE